MRTWLASLALIALACSSSGTWRRVETPNFVLRTDLDATEAKRAAVALETTRDALVSAAWPSFPFAAQKPEVYVLANGLDFERYFGKATHGLFTRNKPPRFFLYGSSSRWELRRTAQRPVPSVLRHEMVHQLASEVWSQMPRWFSEGWAEFLEPIYYTEDQRHVVVGGINNEALSWYRSIRTTKLADALAWNDRGNAEREIKGLYGISWLFVHWLFHRRADNLHRFVTELARGTPPDEAFDQALPNFDAATVDRELFQYQKYFRFNRFDQNRRPLVETPISDASIAENLLAPGDVEKVEALLAAVGASHTRRGRREGAADADRLIDEPSDFAALPMLPQYPCGPEERGNAPSTEDATPSGAPDRAAGGAGSQATDRVAPGDAPRARDGRASSTGGSAPSPESDARGADARARRATSRGKVPPEITERVIRGADEDLRACYNEGLARSAYLGGKVTMRFVIAEDGSVRQVHPVCTSLPDAKVVRCMAERFAKFQFPKPRTGELTVIYPITFAPGG